MSRIAVWCGAMLALAGGAARAQTAELDDLLAQVARRDYDHGGEALLAISAMVQKAHGSEAQTRAIEQRFIALLKSDATAAGKDFVCKQLSVMGSAASVPVLAGMLRTPGTADMARYALERMPGAAVDGALREALAGASGKTRVGIINTLGRRRDAGASGALGKLAMEPDAATAEAALFALGEIADPAAVAALAGARRKSSGALRVQASEAYLKAADRLAAAGDRDGALSIYQDLYRAGEPSTVRGAALRGMAAAGGPQPGRVLVEALTDGDARVQAVAIRALSLSAPGQLAAQMPKLGEAGQIRALGLLAERGEPGALPAFLTAIRGASKPVRIAALEGIDRVGNASVIGTVAGLAVSGDAEEQAAARAALGRIRGKDADQAVIDGIAGAEPKLMLELIRAAGERGTAAAAPALLQMAREGTNEVRRESLRALRETGSGDDVPGMVALVVNPAQPGDRAEAVRSLGAVLRRSDAARIREVVSAYTPASDAETRAALMQVMGQSGNAEAFGILRSGLDDPDPNVKRTAILALSEWPDDRPVPELMAMARSGGNAAHQVLALRGAVKLIALPGSRRAPRETVKLLGEAMSLARQAEEKRSILALLPRYPSREALDLARASLSDSEVEAEAKAAAARLERAVAR